MNKKVVFATENEGKMQEIRMILADVDIQLMSLKEAGITLDVEENGADFADNALIKAREASKKTNLLVLADDSGLEVDFLNREPGVYSARYMGRNTPYEVKNQNLLQRMEGVPEEKRTARFVCAIAAVLSGKWEKISRGTIEGRIGYEIKGENGFGYDPIFYIPEYGCTSAELMPEQKNMTSHRGKALQAMKEKLVEEGVWELKKAGDL